MYTVPKDFYQGAQDERLKQQEGKEGLNLSMNTRTHRLLRKAPLPITWAVRGARNSGPTSAPRSEMLKHRSYNCLPSTWPSCPAPQPSTLQSALLSEQSVRTCTAHPTREDTQPIPFPYSGSWCAGKADLSTLQTSPLPTHFMLVPSDVPRVLRSLQLN